MKLSKDKKSLRPIGFKVKHVAELANLPVTKDEEGKLAIQLSETLDYIKRLDEVDTKRVEPTSQVTGLINVTREDKVTQSLPQEEALKNAKSTYQGYVKVGAILDQA